MIFQDSTKPIYIQLSEWLEGEIMSGHFQTNDKIYSQYQLAEMFTINPATAAKGLTRLLDENILYKKRGLGMFVSENAAQQIQAKRRGGSLVDLVEQLVNEAQQLGVSYEELISLLHTSYSKGDKKA
ncbi:GntR family transcriptional regulator [Shouchella patagoniensis]|uniref:GntR family transcriptional regulator n=1 Tax=Shouchella patagoniensis TaxID=228576 RepID=UPI0009956DD7|nr:GntR family transcriptional regulator [Shouchella patagoniensis]